MGVTLRKNFGSGFSLQSFYLKKNKKDFHFNPLRKTQQTNNLLYQLKNFRHRAKKTTFAKKVKMQCSASQHNNYNKIAFAIHEYKKI